MTAPSLPTYLTGAAPYFKRGTAHEDTGCLVIHGFMSSPGEVKWLGQHLASAGFTVYAPRLFGHGANYRDMRRAHWEDWYLSACDALAMLSAQCARVVVIGHSMGGLLALLLAGDDAQRAAVSGVCLMGTPIVMEESSARYARWLKYVLTYTDQTDRSPLDALVREEQARRGEPVSGRIRYNRWSTSAVGELYALCRVARARLPLVTQPLLLIYSRADRTVSIDQSDRIRKSAATLDVEARILELSGHNIPLDMEREQVFTWVEGFARRFTV